MRILFTFLLLSIGAAFGSIDSGGGRTFVGGNVNYSSIGSPFSTGQNSIGGNLNRSGSLEVILEEGVPVDVPVDPNKDTDGDGIKDIYETNTGTYVSAEDTGTNPEKVDSDGDGFSDGEELAAGANPTSRR